MTRTDEERADVEHSLAETLVDSNAPEVIAQAGEVTIDALLSEGDLKGVPILGTLVGLIRAGATIRDYLFLKKIARFLVQLREIPSERREEFARRLEEDPRFRERLAENLLLVLDRLDDSSKPELIGKIFRAYILGRIDYETCTRLCSAVDRAFYADLLALKKGVRLSEDTTLLLSGAGLMTGTPVSFGEFMPGSMQHDPSGLGGLLLEIWSAD